MVWNLCVHKVPRNLNRLALELVEAIHECRRGWPNLCFAPVADSQITQLTRRKAKRCSCFYGPIVIAVDVVLGVIPRRSLQLPTHDLASERYVWRAVVPTCRIRRGKRQHEQ